MKSLSPQAANKISKIPTTITLKFQKPVVFNGNKIAASFTNFRIHGLENDEFPWAEHMQAVATRIFGQPNRILSRPPKKVCFGERGLISVNYALGLYWNFKDACGGGVWDLIHEFTKCKNYDEAVTFAKKCKRGFDRGKKPEVDRSQLETFIRVVFKYATPGTWISLRAFFQQGTRPFKITPIRFNGDFDVLIEATYRLARLAAREPEKVVFSPPVATFTNRDHAREEDLAEGPVINVECDENPRAARKRLEELLGPATLVVASGGEWTTETGETEPKLHLYFRTKNPARTKDELRKLKLARMLAAKIVGADTSNASPVHPIRWPGSIHRKGDPKLCHIVVCKPDVEIELDAALKILQKAAGDDDDSDGPLNENLSAFKFGPVPEEFQQIPVRHLGEGIEHDRPPLSFAAIKTGCAWLREVHATGGADEPEPRWYQAARCCVYLQNGEQLIHELSDRHPGYSLKTTEAKFEHARRYSYEQDLGWPLCTTIKDHHCEHCESCPHFAEGNSPLHLGLGDEHAADVEADAPEQPASRDEDGYFGAFSDPRPEPEPRTVPQDLWAKFDPPPLPTGLLPTTIEKFAFAQADLMGCDPAGIAMGALTVCAAAIPDDVKLQVKQHDPRWRESTRLWTGLVGLPSVMKSPIMQRVIEPLKSIENRLIARYMEAMEAYEKLSAEERKKIEKPKLARIMLMDTTPEAAQPILRDNPNGMLLFRDELSGWFGSVDKYSGHRGATADRGFWLQAFSGGRYWVDRVTRSSGEIKNLSVSVLGGIQVEPLRKLVAEGVDDGLIQRIFPIMLRSAVLGKDEPLPFDQYDNLVERLHEMPCHIVQFDEAAQQIRQQLERKHLDLVKAYEAVNRKLAAHVGKYNGLFARLCLIWHCIETVDVKSSFTDIDVETAQRVADFLHGFLLPHAVSFYVGVVGLADDHDRLANVAGYILAHKLERITNRDVARGDRSMRKLDRANVESVFNQLDALGWLNKIPGKRSCDVQWVVNPEVHHLFKERAKAETERRARIRDAIAATYGSKENAE